MISKKTAAANKPASALHKVTFGGNKTSRKSVASPKEELGQIVDIPLSRTYKAIASQVAKSGYRPDLREFAVSRASAIRSSQRVQKPSPAPKARGAAAKKQ